MFKIRVIMVSVAVIPLHASAANGGLDTFSLVMLGLLILFTFFALLVQDRKLNDPENKELIYPDQLVEVSTLESAKQYLVTYIRQSGNEYKPPEIWQNKASLDDAEALIDKSALQKLETTLKRARWESCWVLRNESTCFEIMRSTANVRSAGGKRLARIIVTVV